MFLCRRSDGQSVIFLFSQLTAPTVLVEVGDNAGMGKLFDWGGITRGSEM